MLVLDQDLKQAIIRELYASWPSSLASIGHVTALEISFNYFMVSTHGSDSDEEVVVREKSREAVQHSD